jgi:hypothetical protein
VTRRGGVLMEVLVSMAIFIAAATFTIGTHHKNHSSPKKGQGNRQRF